MKAPRRRPGARYQALTFVVHVAQARGLRWTAWARHFGFRSVGRWLAHVAAAEVERLDRAWKEPVPLPSATKGAKRGSYRRRK